MGIVAVHVFGEVVVEIVSVVAGGMVAKLVERDEEEEGKNDEQQHLPGPRRQEANGCPQMGEEASVDRHGLVLPAIGSCQPCLETEMRQEQKRGVGRKKERCFPKKSHVNGRKTREEEEEEEE
jgi:hypothetical protein